MALPSNEQIDAAVPVGGTPSRSLTNAVLKALRAITKGDIGLGNVANTAPADLPISTATQQALNALAGEIDAIPAPPVTSVAGRTGAVTLAKADVGLGNVVNVAVVVSSDAPVDDDGRPDGTVWIQTA